MGLKAPLQFPVRLVFVYTRAGGEEQVNFTSPESYFNSMTINHAAPKEKVPFDKFRVKIALTYKDLVGPFYQQNKEYCEFTLAAVS